MGSRLVVPKPGLGAGDSDLRRGASELRRKGKARAEFGSELIERSRKGLGPDSR